MLKIRGVLCFVAGAASDIFEGGRCRCGRQTWLRSQTFGFFASDPFFARTIFYPKSDTYIFSTSQRYMRHTKDDIKTKNHRNKQWTVTEFECFIHNLPSKKAKMWSKSHGSPIFGCFFGYRFSLTEFFPSASRASRKRRSWKTPEAPKPWRPHPRGGPARQRPGAAAPPPRGSGARARERSVKWPVASKEWLNCDSGGVVGGRCQKKSNILKFGVDRNLDFSMLVYVWTWTSKLLMITNSICHLPLRSEWN